MAVPDFQSLMLPVIQAAAESDTISVSGLKPIVARQFGLRESDLAEMLPSGRMPTLTNRLSWSIVYLAKAGLLQRVQRGRYAVTQRGREVLASDRKRIDIAFLASFPEFEGFAGRRAGRASMTSVSTDKVDQTPDERIHAAFEEAQAALSSGLIARLRAMPPTAFEKLIIDLMVAMRYGADGSAEHVGRSADGGIDGVISEDALGLDVIYLQAKRYAEGAVIGVDKIREFAGSLDERGATKGVFVTTSHFAAPARAYAERSHKRLVLIDGRELTHLLIRYNVGVRVYRSFDMKRIDDDYFDEPL